MNCVIDQQQNFEGDAFLDGQPVEGFENRCHVTGCLGESLAAEFWRRCSLFSCCSGRLTKWEFQKWRREEMRAWTSCSVAF